MIEPKTNKNNTSKWIFLSIAVFIFLAFIKNLAFWSKSQTFIFGDTAIYALYLTSLVKNLTDLLNIKDSFLMWNPNYLAIGIPTLSVLDMGVLYPPNLLAVIIAKISGNIMSIFPLYYLVVLLHLVLGSFFTYKILKVHWNLDDYSSLIGALTWIFIGFNITFIPASSIFMAGSYLPACVYFSLNLVKKENVKNFFSLFILLALSFLAGYPMVSLIIFFTCAAVLLLLQNKIEKRTIVKVVMMIIGGFFLITFPLISPLYFSSLISFPYSVRTNLSLEGFLSNPAQFLEITESILPQNTFLNILNKANSTYFYFSLVGLIILIQAKDKLKILIDKKNILFLLIGLLGLIVSLGKVTFFPSLIYFLLPLVNLFRRLSVFSILPSFVFCLIIAQAVKFSLENKKISKILFFLIAFLISYLVILQTLNILSVGYKGLVNFVFAGQIFNVNFTDLQETLGLTLILLTISLLSLKIYRKFIKLGLILLFFSLLIEAGSIVSGKFNINSEVNPQKVLGPNIMTKNLQDLVKPLDRVDLIGSQNSYSTDFLNLEQTAGYMSLASKYGVAIDEALTRTTAKNLRDILGVKFMVRKVTVLEPTWEKINVATQNEREPNFYYYNNTTSQWEPEFNKTQFAIYRNPAPLKRVYLASNIKLFEQTDKVLKELETLGNPKTVFIDKKDFKENISKEGEVEILEYKRNYLKVGTKNEDLVFLANSTAYYPGWWVKINGKLTKPIQTNWFMMGVYLPEGENMVEFFYVPYGIIAGLTYMTASLIFWLAGGKKLLKLFLN